MYPLGNKKKWLLVISNELFLNLNSHFKGPQARIDQNKFFTGINKKISDNINLEGGYQLQYINQKGPQADKLNHIVLFNLYIPLPQLIED